MNTHTEHLLGLLVVLELRSRSLRDWIDKHPLPDGSHISSCLHGDSYSGDVIEVHVPFESYKAALAWAFMNTACLNDRWGYAARRVSNYDDTKLKGYLFIRLPDFQIVLSFPSSTHLDAK